jgi:hypothetical protein
LRGLWINKGPAYSEEGNPAVVEVEVINGGDPGLLVTNKRKGKG